MKMVYCTCTISTLIKLKEIFDEVGVDNYQIIEEVTGKNVKGEPRLNTAVWPGLNSIMMSQVEEATAAKLVLKIRAFNTRAFNDNELISYCTWTLDECMRC